jgi:cellulose synthase/poly-beta-1,6-N-acetylglucosamine synthase-like glycosyltransferase
MPTIWSPWRFQALLRLEQGLPMFAGPPRGRQAKARTRFIEEMVDEYAIKIGPQGPVLLENGHKILASWRRGNRINIPSKYDSRQKQAILRIKGYGANIVLAERFGTTPNAIKCYRRRLLKQVVDVSCATPADAQPSLATEHGPARIASSAHALPVDRELLNRLTRRANVRKQRIRAQAWMRSPAQLAPETST